MKFVACMSGVLELQEHPGQNFTYVSVGVRPFRMIFGLKLGSAHDHKVLAIKVHANTWVVMCKQ